MNEESHQQLLATLVEHRINIQHCDMLGMTVLHYAAKNFNLCSLKLALAAGVDPELTDEHDQACLELVQSICSQTFKRHHVIAFKSAFNFHLPMVYGPNAYIAERHGWVTKEREINDPQFLTVC